MDQELYGTEDVKASTIQKRNNILHVQTGGDAW